MDEKFRILIVDDEPNNLKLFQQIFGGTYDLKFARDGTNALIATDKHKPDLILLDIMMPKMDGYEVCRRLKANKKTAGIPVIFVTALGAVDDETKGFQLGCVDYITKPISPSIALARVKTHIELKNSKEKVEKLLSKTLTGALKMMSDLISMVNPVVLSQSSRLKRCAGEIGKKHGLEGLWRLEIAATLSQIGTIAIPPGTLLKARNGEILDADEQKLMDSYPAIGKDLLKNIPRLETVAEIIGRQKDPLPDTVLEAWDFITISCQILKMVCDYDNLIISGKSKSKAFSILMQNKKAYSEKLLKILIDIENSSQEGAKKSVNLSGLREGMVLLEDVIRDTDVILLKKFTEISENNLFLLQKNAKIQKIHEPIEVMVR